MGMWRIPDDAAPALRSITVKIPTGSMWASRFWGAFFLLCRASNWEETETSELTPAETAELWRDALFAGEVNGGSMLVGTIIHWPGTSIPDGWHLCNSALMSAAEYPDLFDVIGYTFGGSGGNFQLPNLVDWFAVGASSLYQLGDMGGSKTHTLTEDEIPEHVHGVYKKTSVGATVDAVESFAKTQGQTLDTLSTGGGEAHNNLPPYLALYPIIKMEV